LVRQQVILMPWHLSLHPKQLSALEPVAVLEMPLRFFNGARRGRSQQTWIARS